jgi:hypothetical protein
MVNVRGRDDGKLKRLYHMHLEWMNKSGQDLKCAPSKHTYELTTLNKVECTFEVVVLLHFST